MPVRSSSNESSTTKQENKTVVAHESELINGGDHDALPARDAPDFEGGLPIVGNMLQVGLSFLFDVLLRRSLRFHTMRHVQFDDVSCPQEMK